MDQICHNFYAQFYRRKDVSQRAMREVLEGFVPTFNEAMNETLTQEITERKLEAIVRSMAKGKVSWHDGILMEFFQQLWLMTFTK